MSKILEWLKTLSQSKWFSRKLVVAGGIDAVLATKLASATDHQEQIVFAVCLAFVTAIYTLAQALQNAMQPAAPVVPPVVTPTAPTK